jgi:hypothetical protein
MHREFHGRVGPQCGWLHIDPRTLAAHAVPAGWKCDILQEQERGEYLARLTLLPPPDSGTSRLGH